MKDELRARRLVTSQNDAAPKQLPPDPGKQTSLVTSQNDAAPKRLGHAVRAVDLV